MDWISNPDIWLSLLTLTALEIVLGIDNLIFIAILAGKLPPERQAMARRVGLAVALVTRLALLFTLSWLAGLTNPLFTVLGEGISWRDIVLIGGGLFLMAKATVEIHHKVETAAAEEAPRGPGASFAGVVIQIALIDVVFSFDSVITAVGMAQQVAIMIAAVIVAVAVMMAFANPICEFIERHPTLKMLALSFLLLIGVMLVAESFGGHVGKSYIYFAMGFSLGVELLNIRLRKVNKPVHLYEPHAPREASGNDAGAGAENA